MSRKKRKKNKNPKPYIPVQYKDLEYIQFKPGDVVDYLEILDNAEPKDNGAKRFKCKCNACGNIVILEAAYINRYHLQGKASCGCVVRNEKRSSTVIDMTGKRVGKLVVIKRVENDKEGHAQWLCQCDCGNTTIATGKVLRNGTKRSCGCLHSDVLSRRNYKHGHADERIYTIWFDMNRRINDPRRKSYEYYGGAGLGLYERWDKRKNPNAFPEFYEWAMANGYADNLSIDRKKRNIGYYPDNCRWVDETIQSNNRSLNKYICDHDAMYTFAQFARKYNKPHGFVRGRLDHNHTVDEIVYEAITGDKVRRRNPDDYIRDDNGFIRLVRKVSQDKPMQTEYYRDSDKE